MLKITLYTISFLVLFASCKKNYSCDCINRKTWANGTVDIDDEVDIFPENNKMKEEDAKSGCDAADQFEYKMYGSNGELISTKSSSCVLKVN